LLNDKDRENNDEDDEMDTQQKLTMMVEERFSKANSYEYDQKYADKLRVYVTGGKGGNGCCSFFQAPYGQVLPNGGNGGNGGDIYFKATSHLTNLYQLRRSHFKGNSGKHGTGKGKHGKEGKPVRHSVPVGTEIYKVIKSVPSDTRVKREEEHKTLLADLDRDGKEILIAQGGKGGRGNFTYRDVRSIEQGNDGEYMEIELILKTIADVGLVGFPNAGKSTFLASVSRAFPKIASYPFTTLRPYVGKCNFVDGRSITVADLPGLIKDAHKNKGLGHEFLRHIERTKVILYVIDGTGDDDRRPVKDYLILKDELEKYNKNLLTYKSLIAVNKSDREHTNFKEKFDELQAMAHTKCIPISSKMSTNIQEVVMSLRGLIFNETDEEIIEKLSKFENIKY
jgi:GTPase